MEQWNGFGKKYIQHWRTGPPVPSGPEGLLAGHNLGQRRRKRRRGLLYRLVSPLWQYTLRAPRTNVAPPSAADCRLHLRSECACREEVKRRSAGGRTSLSLGPCRYRKGCCGRPDTPGQSNVTLAAILLSWLTRACRMTAIRSEGYSLSAWRCTSCLMYPRPSSQPIVVHRERGTQGARTDTGMTLGRSP